MSRRKGAGKGNDEPSAPFWMLTYGDVMTLLLTFFVLLLSFSSIQEAKFKEAMGALQAALGVLSSAEAVMENPNPSETTKADVEDMDEQMAEVIEVLESAGLESEFDVVTTSEGYAVRLSSPTLFDLASADLKPEGRNALGKLAAHLAPVGHEIRVEGHTDNIPINTKRFPSNWELSAARSLSVLKFMSESGISSTRLSAAGYGEFKPLMPNDTQENRDVNRRVEIYVKVKTEEARITSKDLMWR